MTSKGGSGKASSVDKGSNDDEGQRLAKALASGDQDAVAAVVGRLRNSPPAPADAAEDYGPTSLLRRILSVGKRAWFIGVFGLMCLVAIPAMFEGVAFAWLIVEILVTFVVIAVVIDAFKRRCPQCRKLLAGHLVRIEGTGSYESSTIVDTPSGPTSVTTTVSTHRRTWRCPFCRTEWAT